MTGAFIVISILAIFAATAFFFEYHDDPEDSNWLDDDRE